MFDSITSHAYGVSGAMIVWGTACVAVTLVAAMFITASPAH